MYIKLLLNFYQYKRITIFEKNIRWIYLKKIGLKNY